MLTPQLLRLGFRFVESFLVQFGHLEAPPRPARPVRLLEVPDQTHWVRAEADGMFAAAVELNSRVRAGQSLGHIVSLDDPAAPGMPVIAPHDGIVYMINIGGRALPDQSVAVIARPAARRFREM
jgi:predicted deacylase